MSLRDVLDLGITASLDGDGGLLLDAPKGALNSELIERIRQSKAELIAEIGGAREDSAGEADSPPTDTVLPIRATRWLLHFLDREPAGVWFVPAADHAEALAAHKDAVATQPPTEVRTPVRNEVRTETAWGCSTCRDRKRPGLSSPGYCGGGRDDLEPAYTSRHPLRKLPADLGASCDRYLTHEGANHA